MSTLLRDLITIPESVSHGDFVLKLTEGTEDSHSGATLRDYVVTPQLAECFDQALKLVQSAIQGQTSKAAYLHGSFGSGKSHFMAVLHFLLQGNAAARSIPELGDVVVRHNEWMGGKRFLMVPFHLLAAKDFESALFEGYVHYIFKHFPEAPVPALFRSDELLKNAVSLKDSMGEERFFAKLNEDRSGVAAPGGWGRLAGGWDAASFEQAFKSAPTETLRKKLVGDLVETHFTAMRSATEFVSIDDGLSIMSAHAKDLGFDGLILFLDELILWLASHAGNSEFVNRESQKLPKLVEASNAIRPAPIISFVARQRDLRELVGQHIAGAEKMGFFDTLSYHEGRFGVIRLEDRNLPAITEKRVLRPVSEAAKRMIDEEFARTATLREDVQKVLMTKKSTREDFRRLYPFSPALVDTLVAVSSLLQRERTALKIMMQLLVKGRDRLELGQVIPVGDLFDEIAEGDDAFNSVMKAHFDEARKLYGQQLSVMLENQHRITFEEAKLLPVMDPRRQGLQNDDRIIKTLLLAALAPQAESLQNMTPQRLSALNHGIIKSFIPGQEAQKVLERCKDWAAISGQIQIHEGAGGVFTISIRISGVDINGILEKAEAVDNFGNRVARVKNLLFESLGVNGFDQVFFRHLFRWKGTDREADIQFGNVREMGEEMIESRSGNWRVLIDYPFDRVGHTISEDEAKLNSYRQTNEPTQTIGWLPSFLNFEAQKDIGRLLRLEHILDPNRYRSFVEHLSEVDQAGAKTQLESMRGQLFSRIMAQVESIYGLREPHPDYVDQANHRTGSEHFVSLDPGLEIRPPVAAGLRDALNGILDQALRYQFPAHPEFDDELKVNKTNVAKVLEVVAEAANTREPSIVVSDPGLRKLTRQMANPLKVGQMAEQRFQLELDHWRNHFAQHEARNPGEAVTVSRLREWIDLPHRQGLPLLLQDLIILAWALQTNRCFIKGVAIPTPAPGDLTGDMILRELALPNQDEWKAAVDRAKIIFGTDASPLANATNVGILAGKLRQLLSSQLGPCQELEKTLKRALPEVGVEESASVRLKTAREAVSMVQLLKNTAGETPLIKALAGFPLQTMPKVLGVAIKSAADVASTLASLQWELFHAVSNLQEGRKERATRLLEELRTSLCTDEGIAAQAFRAHMADLQSRAVRLLADVPRVDPPFPQMPPPVEPLPPVVLPPVPRPLPHKAKQSQVRGDGVPDWVPEPHRAAALVAVMIPGPSQVKTEIVVTATLARLIEAAEDARLNHDGTKLLFSAWGCEVNLESPEGT